MPITGDPLKRPRRPALLTESPGALRPAERRSTPVNHGTRGLPLVLLPWPVETILWLRMALSDEALSPVPAAPTIAQFGRPSESFPWLACVVARAC